MSNTRKAQPRPTREARVKGARPIDERIAELTTLTTDEAVDECAKEIGRLRVQAIADRKVISRLCNHVMMIDPQDEVARAILGEREKAVPHAPPGNDDNDDNDGGAD